MSERVPENNRYPFKKSISMYMSGDDVAQMKDWLTQLNDEYGFTRKSIGDTDYFGFETVHFIRDFQLWCEIKQTGAYDFPTHLALEWVYYNWFADYAATAGGGKKW